MVAERGAQRGAGGLLVHLEREVARRGREGDAAARDLRRADRSLAGTSRSLLAPRLRAAAGDEPAALRCPRALAASIQLRAHGLVHEVRLDVGAEDGLVERDLLLRASEERCLRSCHQRASSRISTSPFFGPGTAPLTSRRFRSGSTEWMVSPTWVTRLPPMRPAMRTPLNTREGVADAPIEPGLRMLCEPCVTGPRWNRCRLTVPWKPLPMEMPATLIFSPGWKISTVTFSPCTASAKWPRNSTRCRYAPSTPFFARWPRSAFEIFRSATASYASCTAS